MACFTFDPAHNLGVCSPPDRIVRGTFDPEADGPGEYTISLQCATTGELIAKGQAQSSDGGAVPLDLPHNHRHAGPGGVFQCNIRCQFDDGPLGVPTPKCLRNG
jgi:hypothetical protein